MGKKGIIKTLGELFGKEVSEELAKEFQDEIDDFKKYLSENRFIENMPNLELETYEILVNNPNQEVVINSKTKIEHKRILGVFNSFRDSQANYDSKVSIQIDRKYIVANGKFHFFLLEKKQGQSIYEAAFRTDVAIDTSDVNIVYKDGGVVSTPYRAYINFICQKADDSYNRNR